MKRPFASRPFANRAVNEQAGGEPAMDDDERDLPTGRTLDAAVRSPASGRGGRVGSGVCGCARILPNELRHALGGCPDRRRGRSRSSSRTSVRRRRTRRRRPCLAPAISSSQAFSAHRAAWHRGLRVRRADRPAGPRRSPRCRSCHVCAATTSYWKRSAMAAWGSFIAVGS